MCNSNIKHDEGFVNKIWSSNIGKICFKDEISVQLEHIDVNGNYTNYDFSEHKICNKCYELLRKNKCPFVDVI